MPSAAAALAIAMRTWHLGWVGVRRAPPPPGDVALPYGPPLAHLKCVHCFMGLMQAQQNLRLQLPHLISLQPPALRIGARQFGRGQGRVCSDTQEELVASSTPCTSEKGRSQLGQPTRRAARPAASCADEWTSSPRLRARKATPPATATARNLAKVEAPQGPAADAHQATPVTNTSATEQGSFAPPLSFGSSSSELGHSSENVSKTLIAPSAMQATAKKQP
mmetsp:Transcript_14691/g.34654  ORF Transcript_14691/g.34654 Transcript_14691/m.34654 type:complete len:221 (-) Transcript_14691:743-1405(-)